MYARRQHEFAQIETPASGKKRKPFLGTFRKDSSSSLPDEKPLVLPFISVDARLPSPAIITCNQSLPLRIFVRRLNDNADPLFLESLHIQLVSQTKIRAQEVRHMEPNSWVILSFANRPIPLRTFRGKPNFEGEELAVDEELWHNHPLPNTIAPSFEACNITRTYSLELKIGIGYGAAGAAAKDRQNVSVNGPCFFHANRRYSLSSYPSTIRYLSTPASNHRQRYSKQHFRRKYHANQYARTQQTFHRQWTANNHPSKLIPHLKLGHRCQSQVSTLRAWKSRRRATRTLLLRILLLWMA